MSPTWLDTAPGAARRLLASAAVLGGLAALAPPVAQAQSGVSVADSERTDDYDADSERWNGINTLTAVAKGVGLQVEAVDSIEWEDLGTGDILVILYPRDRLDPGHVAGFIRNGGHLLLADDFGDSTEAIGRLGMLRDHAVGVRAPSFYQDLAYVPVATPLIADHPLVVGVSELATNHPAVLTQINGPDLVFGFGPNEGVIAAGALGRGRFIVSSDPSIFINRMLQFQGNLQFTVNAFRFLNREGTTRRAVILANDFDLYGEPETSLDDGTVAGTMGNILGELNRWLDERNDYLLTAPGILAVAIILAILIALVAVASLPLKRKGLFDGSWTRPSAVVNNGISPGAIADFAAIVNAHDSNAKQNFLLPATVIRDTVDARLSRLLGEPEPLHSRKTDSLMHAVAEKVGPNAAHALEPLCRSVRSLPSREQAASPWSTGHVSRAELERLERMADGFLRAVDSAEER